ncbi:MAG TPA: alanine--tRNA ligase [Candidatus Portnoybacteria bacterium]|uniref:Alanine--tRNA ligase n=1 Tax=Candidatus Portnoybacteria bacterium CG02_land_8_20_14_3_00_45_8 TaxID=1974807 RepID=A0A2M7D5P4_9BACT|nr:MAG: alanine--tRNA ligase [Candidatus Portnoybacteria bacterium CG02_land_8_20_14_3_00_45_8]HCX27744.1 alanine--tRNA ligase [Candidatus Portnoybacteria bacterium]
MTANELRQLYLDFFKSKGHAIIPSASLIPENDPTALFTTAGMHPLVPYLMGEKHPAGQRLVNCQKCIRTSDIDEVGDNRHLTFFEMLGNWSLGDPSTTFGASYFKKEAIEWSWKFLFDKKWLGMDPQRLYVTVFMGDKELGLASDEKSIKIWQECFKKNGITAEVCPYNTSIGGNRNYRIFPLPAKDNFWGPAGATGPCGPCTEMFYDVSPEKGALRKTFDEEMNAFRVMEVWNDVFMEFNKNSAGQYEKLSAQNVDTGMGLERTISVLNGKQDAFENELFYPLIQKIEELSGKKYGIKITSPQPSPFEGEGEDVTRAMRVIADHIKAATFILGDEKGLTPSNVGAGYVLRRLIRRAVRYGKQLGINEIFTFKVAEEVIKIYQDIYAELRKNKEFIVNQLVKEEEKFLETLEKGLKEFEKMKPKFTPLRPPFKKSGPIEYGWSGDDLFNLYSTYGFPIELSIEEMKKLYETFKDETGIGIVKLSKDDEERILHQFHEALQEHQELSRTASAGMFKGGLADASEETIKYHTAAHLMLAALRKVLGERVVQKGSNITPERLRFDFSHSEKMTAEQIKEVENIVNEQIQKDLPVVYEEMMLDEAKAAGAMGVFESKYGEKVKVYMIGDFSTSSKDNNIFSREICGGPHAQRTGMLGRFKITKEESSSAGVRRIKATLD